MILWLIRLWRFLYTCSWRWARLTAWWRSWNLTLEDLLPRLPPVRSVSALKDLSELLMAVVLLAVLFPVRPDLSVVPVSIRAPAAIFVALELIDILSEAFAVSLLCFRPPWMLLAGCLSSVPGLVRSLALLVSFVLRAETFGAASRVSFLDFVIVTEGFFSILTVCFLRFRSVSVRLGELLIATLGCFFTAAGGDFGLLIRVVICEVLGERVRADDFGATRAAGDLAGRTDVVMREVFAGLIRFGGAGLDGFGTLRAAGDLAGRTDVVMREVFAGLILFGGAGLDGFGTLRAAGDLAGRTDVVMREVFAGLILFGGAGFDGFGTLRAAGGLGALRLGVTLGAGVEALGDTERGACRLDLGALALADERGRPLRCGRAEALGAGWGLFGRATLAAGALLLPTFEGLLALAAGADF